MLFELNTHALTDKSNREDSVRNRGEKEYLPTNGRLITNQFDLQQKHHFFFTAYIYRRRAEGRLGAIFGTTALDERIQSML